MSESHPVPAAPLPLPDRSPAAPLFLWLVIQLLALSLGTLRVPLSARFPPPGEQFAIHIMLVTQIVTSALLFPFLMRDAKTSAMVILTIAPFVQLASYLSMVSLPRAALAMAYVATWLATLALWRPLFHEQSTKLLGVSSAVAISLGGAVVWYVRAESLSAAAIDWSRDGLFGSLLGAIAQIEATSVPQMPWLAALVLLGVSAVAYFLMRKRHVGHNGSRPSAS